MGKSIIVMLNFEERSLEIRKGRVKKERDVWLVHVRRSAFFRSMDIKLPTPPANSITGRKKESKDDFILIGSQDGVNWFYITELTGDSELWQCTSCSTLYDDIPKKLLEELQQAKLKTVTGKQKEELKNQSTKQFLKELQNNNSNLIPGLECEECKKAGNIKRVKLRLLHRTLKIIPQDLMKWNLIISKKLDQKYRKKSNWEKILPWFALVLFGILLFLGLWYQTKSIEGLNNVKATCEFVINGTQPLAAGFLFPLKKIFKRN